MQVSMNTTGRCAIFVGLVRLLSGPAFSSCANDDPVSIVVLSHEVCEEYDVNQHEVEAQGDLAVLASSNREAAVPSLLPQKAA